MANLLTLQCLPSGQRDLGQRSAGLEPVLEWRLVLAELRLGMLRLKQNGFAEVLLVELLQLVEMGRRLGAMALNHDLDEA